MTERAVRAIRPFFLDIVVSFDNVCGKGMKNFVAYQFIVIGQII